MSVKKYFLAIVIPPPIFEEVEKIKQQLFDDHGLKGALRCPAHITLHRPFEWKEEKEKILIEKWSELNFLSPFTIELNDFSFFEPRVIYIDVLANANLLNLHQQVKQFAKKELKLYNEVNDLRAFHPHITVASRDLKKPLFYQLQEDFMVKKFSDSFNCSGFCLLKLEKKWEILHEYAFVP